MAYYIVHKKKIKENINKLKNAFLKKGLNFQLFYSVKTNFMEPVLLLFMGLIVAFVALAIITPIYKITQTLGR